MIKSIDGHKIVLGRDIQLYFLNHPMDGSAVEIEYERDGETYTTSLDPSYEAYMTGFSYYASEEPASITALTEGLDMEKQGAQVGDVITAVNGTKVADGNALQAYMKEHPLEGRQCRFLYS